MTNFVLDTGNMKYTGSIQRFKRMRDEEIMRIYHTRLAEADFIFMPDIFQKVADSPSSRFWVSEERAAVVVAAMLAGKPLPPMRANKREMFGEIFRRFLNGRREHPGKTLAEVVEMVVNQPAPRLYMTPRYVGEVIYNAKRERHGRKK